MQRTLSSVSIPARIIFKEGSDSRIRQLFLPGVQEAGKPGVFPAGGIGEIGAFAHTNMYAIASLRGAEGNHESTFSGPHYPSTGVR